MTLTSQFPHSVKIVFLRDLNRLIDMFEELDKEYGAASEDFQYNKPICEKYIDAFDKKYTGIKVAFEQKSQRMVLHIMINEKSLSRIFDEALSKIGALVSIGSHGFDEAMASNESELRHVVSRAKSSLHLKYSGYEKNTIILRLNLQYGLPEINLLSGDKIRENTPEGELLAYYALAKGGQKSLKLTEISNSFCYSVHGMSGKDQTPGFFN